MIAKTISHATNFKGVLYYCLGEKKNAEILDLNGLSRSDPKGLLKEFEAICDENKSISKPVWHSILSFSETDRVSVEQMKEMANKLIEKVGFSRENNQFVIIQHKDKDHMHCHIIANRIGYDGKAVNDYHSKIRTVQVAKQIEKEYNLTQVQEIAIKRRIEHEIEIQDNPVRKQIARAIDSALKESGVKSFQDLAFKLKTQGIDLNVLKHANTGKEYGITFKTGNLSFKGSELGKNYAFKALSEQLHPAIKLIVKVISKGLELGL